MIDPEDDLAQARAAFSGCDADIAAALTLAVRLTELGVWDLDSGKVEAGLYVVAQAFADVRQEEPDELAADKCVCGHPRHSHRGDDGEGQCVECGPDQAETRLCSRLSLLQRYDEQQKGLER